MSHVITRGLNMLGSTGVSAAHEAIIAVTICVAVSHGNICVSVCSRKHEHLGIHFSLRFRV